MSPVHQSPEPNYDEKRVLKALEEAPTGEYHVPPDQVPKLLKGVLRLLRKRNNTRNSALAAGLLSLAGGGWKIWDQHDRMRELERRQTQLEKDLTEARIDAAHCCPRKGGDL